VAERAAVAATEREADLIDNIREEVTKEIRAEASAEIKRLDAALSVAAGQEAAATAVATQLRASLLVAEQSANTGGGYMAEANSATALEAERAFWLAEKEELMAALNSARRGEMEQGSLASQWRSACTSLQNELDAKVMAPLGSAGAAPSEGSASLQLDAARREHELQTALVSAKHQRQTDYATQEAEKQQLQAQATFLMHELEVERQNSARSQDRLQDAELGATSLREENRRLQAELRSEFSVATAAALEASVSAKAAASSVAALEERSRATPGPSFTMSSLDSPSSSKPLARRLLLQDSESLASTPCGLLRSAWETPSTSATLVRSQPGATPVRLPHAGDVAAGGAGGKSRRKVAEATMLKDGDDVEVERPVEEDVSTRSPFAGGPLGRARALVPSSMRSMANRSKSPGRRFR